MTAQPTYIVTGGAGFVGLLAVPTLPRLEGMDDFKGRSPRIPCLDNHTPKPRAPRELLSDRALRHAELSHMP